MATDNNAGKVAINFASAEDLAAKIPGVGRKLANAIVVVRHSSGNITPEVLTTISRRQFTDEELELVDFAPNAQWVNPQDSDSDEDEFEDTVEPEQGRLPNPASTTWAVYFGNMLSSARKLLPSAPQVKTEPCLKPKPRLKMPKRGKSALDYAIDDLPKVPTDSQPQAPVLKTPLIQVRRNPPQPSQSDSDQNQFASPISNNLVGPQIGKRPQPHWASTPVGRFEYTPPQTRETSPVYTPTPSDLAPETSTVGKKLHV